MKEKTIKFLKLKIEKLIWLSSSLFWIITAIVALNKEYIIGAIIFFAIGIATWKGQNKEKWEQISKTEEFVRNNWK